MIIDNFENDLQAQVPQDFDPKVYNPNKSFTNKKYFRRFTHQIALKNWTSLLKVHQKIESLLIDDSKVIISEKIAELYDAIDFDPSLYKDDKKKLSAHPKRRDTCKEIIEICDSLNKTGTATVVNIMDLYNRRHQDEPRKRGFIRKYLRMANYTFKKCSVKNPKITTCDFYYRKLYVIDVLTSKLLDDYLVLSIDETPLNTFSNAQYFWLSNDSKDVYKTSLKKSGFSMIMAVGLDEICYHRVYETSNNAETFWSFVNDTLITLEVNEKYKQKIQERKVIIFIDNAKIHYSKVVRAQFLKYKIEILYNVPYESSFNPIELVFRCIKSKVKKYKMNSFEKIKEAYMLAIIDVKSYDVLRSWKSSVKAMFRSIKLSN